ncbi:cytochrome c5 family protein [Gammaproteobacteria bacterium 42_54_T18]|nr:cytochrome c5 family protein [Gammaproteobacteria bacterium 42_54_T18]
MKKLVIATAIAALGFAASVQAEGPAKYDMYCMACHGFGAAGAPITGNKEAWAPRLTQGMDALVASAKTGKGAMPPMGLCADCSDDELKELITFMSTAK